MPDRLADLTTLHLGGPAATLVEATTEDELVAAVSDADGRGEPLLLVAGGSNLVVSDDGFPGTAVRIATRGITTEPTSDGVTVTVAAGEVWDDLVARAVTSGWVGVEALSGIPGSVGATPIQNVGAYGQEVSETIVSVRVWDRTLRGVRTFTNADCGFGYRHSRFKADPGRHVVLEVTFQFPCGDLGAPVKYAELARTLGVEQGERAPLADVRRTVLGLRAGKGMVLDAADHDTWSAGSFFTNPFLTPEQAQSLPEGAPLFPQPDGTVKSSAAWLIERAGFTKGHGNERVSLSTKHTLALTNRGRATTDDLLALAREVRDGVEARFGIRLVNEPVMVGCSL
ncbi:MULTISPECIES: UDP-N-acetylmuramate dehydrogenase [unclassified Nocardioides]|uniref:UDP-N-acetylmuramate dehydrogenase n=1 Tax=unclassified Nocardioides TaxID=2615069 RepID=UPI0006F5DE41|nr:MULTISPECIES: UDP-N-acetylmuramate dehydrogenase [unclassified Nocardioides]KQY56852.1 UDP-N-acetylenolpyruvoylglucosamine reductase [Nocardioides sp. Root140]KQZ66952.1 UDP-N-acetylenolpyruvoylglucosamine reductase [Nocardioides sp. Root151]KRF12973.1 UDP-N-acetylenolpyruvoylglucosamine reductase [Nocardioides sp. Soil796]